MKRYFVIALILTIINWIAFLAVGLLGWYAGINALKGPVEHTLVKHIDAVKVILHNGSLLFVALLLFWLSSRKRYFSIIFVMLFLVETIGAMPIYLSFYHYNYVPLSHEMGVPYFKIVLSGAVHSFIELLGFNLIYASIVYAYIENVTRHIPLPEAFNRAWIASGYFKPLSFLLLIMAAILEVFLPAQILKII